MQRKSKTRSRERDAFTVVGPVVMRAKYVPAPDEAERVAAFLASYRGRSTDSRTISQDAADFAREIVTETAPPTLPEAQRRLSAFTLYVAFCEDQGFPLDRDLLLDLERIDWYVDADNSARRTTKSKATAACAVKRVVRIATNNPRPETARWNSDEDQAVAPFTRREIQQMFDFSSALSPLARLRVRAALIFTLGSGADTGDLAALRGTDVTRDSSGVVRVTYGEHHPDAPTRTVVMQQRFEQEACDLAQHAGPRRILANPAHPDGQIRCDNIFTNAWKRHPNLTRPTIQRLRVTWLVERLSDGVRLDVLCAAAGVRPSMLDRYMQFVPALPPTEADLLLRGSVTESAA